MKDCKCDGNSGCCFPNCLPEADQQALANDIYQQLYGGNVTPIKPPEPACNFGMSPTDRLVDAGVIIAVLVLILGFLL